MNKYIDAEKLIAEIEKLKEPYRPYLSDFENGCIEGRNDALDDIISLITSLQQEQPEVDLKKEYERFVASDPVYSKLTNGIVGKAIARHFYELARQKYEK